MINQKNMDSSNMSDVMVTTSFKTKTPYLESMPGIPLHPWRAEDPTSPDQGWIQRKCRICPKTGSFYSLQLYFSLHYFGPELAAHQDCCSSWKWAPFLRLHACVVQVEKLRA